MENYTDNSNDRPYDKNTGSGKEIKKKGSSHDYEYWTKMKNKKNIEKKKDGAEIQGRNKSSL